MNHRLSVLQQPHSALGLNYMQCITFNKFINLLCSFHLFLEMDFHQ